MALSTGMVELYWLPKIEEWRDRLRRLGTGVDGAFDEAVALAGSRIDPVETNALGTMLRRSITGPPPGASEHPGAPGAARGEHAGASSCGDPRRRVAPPDVGRNVREQLRPV